MPDLAFNLFRQLYSLDTLDTRFIVPATAPPKEALEEAQADPAKPLPVPSGRPENSNPAESAQSALWNTPEFYFYYIVFMTAIPLMIKSVYDVSKGQS
jgi:hypothetical protein